MSRLAYYRDLLQFDNTRHIPFTKEYKIGCSQCAAMVINGVPCHERGCPHDNHECHECNNRVPAGIKYCEDCAGYLIRHFKWRIDR